ncbi:DUF2249 domain-containing protein [Herpetosiphon giganteus]|uniref:DUF2249 domain-containing protein n=1 Tax=Herpetosiphon giganteus TaxID=2029754 RepID=UPI00195CFDB3|nr:DUF2249 domain-containing protein [Herpetosiphon giganteus]MBM7844950.1 hypothetical protein [Herpetosiphon giganteus]
MITATMTVADILKRYPNLLEVFVSQHTAFQRLRNPLLRRVFARMVTVEQAAQIAKIEPASLLQALNQAQPEPAVGTPLAEDFDQQPDPTTPPAWLQLSHITALLDVREAQATAQNPLALITPATLALAADQLLLLRSGFEPVPLYQWLDRRGYQAWAYQHTDDDWLVFIRRVANSEAQQSDQLNPAKPCVVLDNRGLKPPEPMVRTITTLKRLPPASYLIGVTDRIPVILHETLSDEGYSFESVGHIQQAYLTLITAL